MRPLPAALPTALKDIAGVMPASRLERPPSPTVSSGIAAVDKLTGGFPRGALTEICGAASSGRTTLTMAALAAATAREELCALIDAADGFDPASAQAAGVNLDRLLWVRCSGENPASSPRETIGRPAMASADPKSGDLAVVQRTLATRQQTGSIMPPAKVWYGRSPARSEREPIRSGMWFVTSGEHGITDNSQRISRHGFRGEKNLDRRESNRRWASPVEQALKAADLLLQSGGFGVVVIDFADVPVEIVQRVPLTSWFRFRRAVENTPAVLLAIAQESCAKTCASLVLRVGQKANKSLVRLGVTELRQANIENAAPSHARIFAGLNTTIEIVRSRIDATAKEYTGKKPPQSTHSEFTGRTEWERKIL